MTRHMSSPSSSSSATAGARRWRRPSRNALRMVAAAALAAATVWMPVAALVVFGPLGFALWLLFALAAAAFYVRVWRQWVPVLAGLVLDVGALALTALGLLVAGCGGDQAGHVDRWMWALGAMLAFAIGTGALSGPSRVLWALPLGTLAGAVVVIGLAVVLNGNTGLCPD